jgi:hypothetical protein
MNAYILVVMLHSWVRWLVLLAGLVAAIAAWTQSLDDTRRTDRWGRLFMIAADTQMLLGLTLYVGVSPMIRAALSDWGRTMQNPWVRFFALDHVVIMVVAIALIHAGRRRASTAPTPVARQSRLRGYFTVALVLMLVATPWPFTTPRRELFRTWSIERD